MRILIFFYRSIRFMTLKKKVLLPSYFVAWCNGHLAKKDFYGDNKTWNLLLSATLMREGWQIKPVLQSEFVSENSAGSQER